MTDQTTPEFYRTPPFHHWLLFPLLSVSVIQALWQHGHQILTPAILAVSALAPWIACISDQTFSRNQRRYGQIGCAILGLAWLSNRIQSKTPTDLALIESLAVISLAFAFSRKAEEYDYLFLTSIIFVVYGGCAPARGIYIVLLPVSVILILAYLYTTRSGALAHVSHGVPRAKTPPNVWWVRGTHLGVVLVIWIVVFLLYPSTRRHGAGFVGVSYETRNSVALAPNLQRWLPSASHIFGDNPTTRMDGTIDPDHDPSSNTLTAGDWNKPASQGKGNGAGMPGEDLVMRVRSPVKLYWVGQLYDRYDGQKWTATERANVRKKKFFTEKQYNRNRVVVPQTFIIEKWISHSLFAAFDPVGYSMPANQTSVNTRQRTCGKRIVDGQIVPEPPFQYSVRSNIYQPDKPEIGPKESPVELRAMEDYWHDPLPPKYFLKLPRKIPSRVLELAQRITHDANTPLEKTTAIRNFLRAQFPYQQFSKKTPPDRETVDYFLFDLKEGHCEYFAASLAVLSRAVGVPARVATGFSPGNYNTLTDYFEVYEYHAHAWAQVYIPNQGWITMDATPPGSMQTRNTPALIGDLRDPFSDDWEVTPPELSEDLNEYAKRAIEARPYLAGSNGASPKPYKIGMMTKIAMNFPVNRKELSQLINKWTGTKGNRQNGAKTTVLARIWQTIKINFKSMIEEILASANRLWLAIRPIHVTSLSALIILTTIGIIWIPGLLAGARRRKRLEKCSRMWSEAEALRSKKPDACIRNCYHALKELLALAGYPKPNGQDALDFAKSLETLDPNLSRDLLAVVELYSRVKYSPEAQSTREARVAFTRASNARTYVTTLLEPTA